LRITCAPRSGVTGACARYPAVPLVICDYRDASYCFGSGWTV